MGTPSPRCTVELKRKAVELYGKSGTTCAEVVRGLGCDAGSLSDWAMKADAARPALDANPFQMVEDLRRRKRENERLKRESEMLLKASAFYATLGRPSSSGQLASSNSAGATWYSATLVSKTFQFRVRTRYKGPNTTRIIRGALLDWLHLFGRFREDQACFPELDRGYVSQRRMNSEVVVPMHVVRQLDLQLARRAERLAVDGLGLQHLVGRLVDRVVVRAPFLDSDRSMPKTSSISSTFALSNSLPRSAWNTSMSDIGNSSVAKAALARAASLRGLAEWPTISRLLRSTSRQA